MVSDARVADPYCQNLKRPNAVKNCEVLKCSYVWVEELWSPCSKTCGEGRKRRNVTCRRVLPGGFKDPTPIDERLLLSNTYCNIYEKPKVVDVCNDRNCNDQFFWVKEDWSRVRENI